MGDVAACEGGCGVALDGGELARMMGQRSGFADAVLEVDVTEGRRDGGEEGGCWCASGFAHAEEGDGDPVEKVLHFCLVQLQGKEKREEEHVTTAHVGGKEREKKFG